MAVIRLPTRLKLVGKTKDRSQMCEVLTPDSRAPDMEGSVTLSCIEFPKQAMAFHIDPDNQFLAEDRTWHQLLSEDAQVPICVRKVNILADGVDDEKDRKARGSVIFRLAFKRAVNHEYENMTQDDIWNRFIWIVSIVCGSMLIIAAMNLLWG